MLTADRLRQVLSYDAETGVFTWRDRISIRIKVGNRAGRPNWKGYRQIGIDGALIMEHKLAWLYVYGEWPNAQIDHINRDKADNRIANLRLATNSQNHINKGLQKNNTSGFKGVVWEPSLGKWRARIKVNGRNKYLGVFASKEDAAGARRDAERRYFGEFSS